MRIDVVSIFPEIFAAVTAAGITGRAHDKGLWALRSWDPREFSDNKYRRVDDRPYGGGPGMVMMLEPLERLILSAREQQRQAIGSVAPVLLMSPQGARLDHASVRRLATLPAMTLICGRYEAVDQRFIDAFVDEEISIGDYVVSGGELPAMVLIDAVVRLLPGAVNDPASVEQESFAAGLLDCPHYTRPENSAGRVVPSVLLSGDHARIARWRRDQALQFTGLRRPDLIAGLRAAGQLSAEDERVLAGLQS